MDYESYLMLLNFCHRHKFNKQSKSIKSDYKKIKKNKNEKPKKKRTKQAEFSSCCGWAWVAKKYYLLSIKQDIKIVQTLKELDQIFIVSYKLCI